MKIQKVWAIAFSATGNTERTVKVLAEELAGKLGCPMEQLSFTKPTERSRGYSFCNTDLVVIGSPTYAGKLPNKILPDFRSRLYGNGALAIPVVTFGNRSYDNALAELCAVAEQSGFHTVAAGAFVGQHAMTDELGYGRPGWSDQFEMKGFVGKAALKIRGLTEIPNPIQVPGDPDAPYYVPKGTNGEAVNFLKAKPKTNLKKCTNCGACARQCPMGAIDLKNVSNVPGTCIKCQRCVRKCTKNAKYFDDPALLDHVAMLEREFTDSKDNEVFF